MCNNLRAHLIKNGMNDGNVEGKQGYLPSERRGGAAVELHQGKHHLDYRSETEPHFAGKHGRQHVLT